MKKKERKKFPCAVDKLVQKFTTGQCTKNKAISTTVKWTSVSQPLSEVLGHYERVGKKTVRARDCED